MIIATSQIIPAAVNCVFVEGKNHAKRARLQLLRRQPQVLGRRCGGRRRRKLRRHSDR